MNLRPHAGFRLARSIALAAPLLGISAFAHAALVTTSDGKATINESPYGLPATTGGAVTSIDLTGKVGLTSFAVAGANGYTASLSGNAAVVQGSSSGYAAPVSSSGSPITTPYFSTGANPGPITLTFNAPEKYLGFLWGSIDATNTLVFTLSDGTTETITGTQGLAAATGPGSGIPGSQSFGGSQYILINFLNNLTFTKVVLNQALANPNNPSFESANFQYSTTNQKPLPEPTSIALVGIGAGALLVRRRKARFAKAA